MAEITDTEVVVPKLRRVKLGDQTFRVPPSPTMKYYFWAQRFIKTWQDGSLGEEDVLECYDQTIDFLRRYNKDVDEDALQASCELGQLITFIATVLGTGDAEEDEGDAAPPPARSRSGTAAKRGSSQRTSGSRSST